MSGIASIADYRSALRERPTFIKTAARAAAVTALTTAWNTLWDGSGTPGAGALNVGNTANGAVPTDATAGAPTLQFSTGVGYLSLVDAACMASSWSGNRCLVYDRLFHAGAFAFNAASTLASQPSFSSRVPGSTDFSGLRLWVEIVTTFTGIPSIAVTYTNQAGTAAQSTGTFSLGVAPTIGTMWELPLASGDSGVQKVESVTATVASAGTFNILVARPLWSGTFFDGMKNAVEAYAYKRHWLDKLGLPRVFPDSCLAAMYIVNVFGSGGSAPTPTFDFGLEVASL